LVGSYLGVNELWNEKTPCGDDGVEDTPIHNSPTYQWDNYKHFSTCKGYPVKMTMNLMDNTDDVALYMFTEGQKMRIQAMVSKDGARGKLAIAGATQCEGKSLTDPVVALRSNSEAESNYKTETVAIYPNPANHEITIAVKATNTSTYAIMVYNQLGSVVHQSQSGAEGNTPITLDTETWTEGIYFFQIRLKDRQYTEKILIAH
jgi:Secretion system C-terminal sorting domain